MSKRQRLIYILMLPTFLACGALLLERTGFFNIQDIEIKIAEIKTQSTYTNTKIEDLDRKLKGLIGQSLLRTSVDEVSVPLSDANWIQSYSAYRHWPNKLVVKIEPKEIALLLINPKDLKKGLVQPITESGEFLEKVPASHAPQVTLLTGEVFQRNPQQRKNAIQLKKSLPVSGQLATDRISEITYDQKNGFSLRTHGNKFEIKLGDTDFSERASRVSQVLDYLSKKGVTPNAIDANLSKKVLVRVDESEKSKSSQ